MHPAIRINGLTPQKTKFSRSAVAAAVIRSNKRIYGLHHGADQRKSYSSTERQSWAHYTYPELKRGREEEGRQLSDEASPRPSSRRAGSSARAQQEPHPCAIRDRTKDMPGVLLDGYLDALLGDCADSDRLEFARDILARTDHFPPRVLEPLFLTVCFLALPVHTRCSLYGHEHSRICCAAGKARTAQISY